MVPLQIDLLAQLLDALLPLIIPNASDIGHMHLVERNQQQKTKVCAIIFDFGIEQCSHLSFDPQRLPPSCNVDMQLIGGWMILLSFF